MSLDQYRLEAKISCANSYLNTILKSGRSVNMNDIRTVVTRWMKEEVTIVHKEAKPDDLLKDGFITFITAKEKNESVA